MSFDWSLAVFVVLVVAAASSGVFFKPGEWYRSLRKPGWTPPNWVFGPVWSVLYIMIAVAGWLVWRADPSSLVPQPPAGPARQHPRDRPVRHPMPAAGS